MTILVHYYESCGNEAILMPPHPPSYPAPVGTSVQHDDGQTGNLVFSKRVTPAPGLAYITHT